MNKKQMIDEIQSLKRRVDYIDKQLVEEYKTRRKMSEDICHDIKTATELHLPVPGMRTLSVSGDPLGRDYVRVVDLMLAMLKHVGLKLEYFPGSYALKGKDEKAG